MITRFLFGFIILVSLFIVGCINGNEPQGELSEENAKLTGTWISVQSINNWTSLIETYKFDGKQLEHTVRCEFASSGSQLELAGVHTRYVVKAKFEDNRQVVFYFASGAHTSIDLKAVNSHQSSVKTSRVKLNVQVDESDFQIQNTVDALYTVCGTRKQRQGPTTVHYKLSNDKLILIGSPLSPTESQIELIRMDD